MRSLEELHLLSAKLEGKHNGEDGAKSEIRLTYKSFCSTETEVLCISLRRTIRVPDNGMTYGLPPDLGPFPIYSVNKYMNNLPEIMVAKGGVFVPIHQREAMWINFTSYHPFAVKVCVGGVNAVSGEYTVESLAKSLRRKAKLDKGESIQDYVVTGLNGQQWLDGVAKLDGKVMQFVATSAGNGYSVEAQITGADEVCGIQIEIIPSVINEGTSRKFCVKTLTGKDIVLSIDAAMTVYELKMKICQIEGIPVDQQRE
ncbi:hypothetical protein DID88_001799 [Monilinia fructigena]|uniref:Ubiquitin-like domain-containing protein n=1 Tax=Monilinia fructigena TaxID=38457 RepID=A0A395IYA6_9HELO|nr:hypothetical protein DID88_001799 [Monilinia fructigena]